MAVVIWPISNGGKGKKIVMIKAKVDETEAKRTGPRPRETKRGFFARIIKADRLLAKLTKREKRPSLIQLEMKKVISEKTLLKSREWLVHSWEAAIPVNWRTRGVGVFLGTQELSKLNQEDTNP